MKNVLITGVSTGIGYSALKEFINRGYRVYGSVRKSEDAERLSSEFGENFRPLIFDVTDDDAIQRAKEKVESEIGSEGLACLVNNSGIAEGGPVQLQSMRQFRKHFDVNVFGLVSVTKAFLNLLGAQEDCPFPPGKIINISSVAGQIAAPFLSAYAGSKHAVEGISHSLRRELIPFGIDVIIVAPGAVKTPIWEKGIHMKEYKDSFYGQVLRRFGKGAEKGAVSGLSADYIGEQIVNIMERSKPKTRYAFVPKSFSNWTIPKMLSHRALDNIIKKRLWKM